MGAGRPGAGGGYLLWSDVPENKIFKWVEELIRPGGEVVLLSDEFQAG